MYNIFGISKFKDNEVENKLKEHTENIKTKDLFQYENLRTYIAWDIYRRVTKMYNQINEQEIPHDELEEINKEEEKLDKQNKIIQSEQQPILSQYNISIDDKLLIESLETINRTYPDYMHHLKMVINEEICKTIDNINNYPLEMSILDGKNPEMYRNCPVKSKIKVKDLSDYDKKRFLDDFKAENITEEMDIINAIFCSNCKINLIESSNLCLPCTELHDR